MRSFATIALSVLATSIISSAALAENNDVNGKHVGRFVSGGVFKPSEARRKKFPQDDNIIAVIDTTNGVVRECGDITGECDTIVPFK